MQRHRERCRRLRGAKHTNDAIRSPASPQMRQTRSGCPMTACPVERGRSGLVVHGVGSSGLVVHGVRERLDNLNAVAFPTPRAKAQTQSKSAIALAHFFRES
jgi:hypothetical protein